MVVSGSSTQLVYMCWKHLEASVAVGKLGFLKLCLIISVMYSNLKKRQIYSELKGNCGLS